RRRVPRARHRRDERARGHDGRRHRARRRRLRGGMGGPARSRRRAPRGRERAYALQHALASRSHRVERDARRGRGADRRPREYPPLAHDRRHVAVERADGRAACGDRLAERDLLRRGRADGRRRARALRSSQGLPAYRRRHLRLLPGRERHGDRRCDIGRRLARDRLVDGRLARRHRRRARHDPDRLERRDPLRARPRSRADARRPAQAVRDVQRDLGANAKNPLRRRRAAGGSGSGTYQGIQRLDGPGGRFHRARDGKHVAVSVARCVTALVNRAGVTAYNRPGLKVTLKAMIRKAGLLAALVLAAGCGQIGEEATIAESGKEHWRTVERYCIECHNEFEFAGDLAFDRIAGDRIADHAERLETAVRKLRGGLMPPADAPRPNEKELNGLIAWLEGALDRSAAGQRWSRSIPPHRLNRKEYQNAVRDLLALDIDAASLLPLDEVVEHFDNIASGLQVSPSFIEQYVAAARAVAVQAVGRAEVRPGSETYRAGPGLQQTHVKGLPLGTRGGLVVEHYFPADGEYVINIA